MKRFALFLGLASGLTILSLGLAATPAQACTILLPYSPDVELFESGDFNNEGSGLDRDFHKDHPPEDEAPKILGVRRIEIVATVDPIVISEGQPSEGLLSVAVSRGSVAVVTDHWGQSTGELAPYTFSPQKWAPYDSPCVYFDPPNHDLGRVWYEAVTPDGTLEVHAADTEVSKTILDSGFGERTSVDRDQAAEDLLLAEIQAEHDRLVDAERGPLTQPKSNRIVWIALTVGTVVAVAAVVVYVRRKRARPQANLN